jgi:two-component system OmpR family sensor kinase
VIDLHAEEPVLVSGDPHQLRQVLGNLMRNTLVHTPPGTAVDVSVSARGERAVLEVRDHGPGLPPGDTQALFERFWRMEKGRERGRAGAGLGLAIVAGIVAAHGGKVAAENAPDGGARFTVELPARTARAARSPAATAV